MRTSQRFSVCYLLLSLVILTNDWWGFPSLYYVTKPLIMISLIGYVVSTQQSTAGKGKKLFLVGMFFALLGDILLLLKGYFLQGLAAFLVTQWCYLLAFRKDLHTLVSMRFALATLLVIGSSIAFVLVPVIQAVEHPVMQVAVSVYGISIGSMVWLAALRKNSASTTSYFLVLLGGCLFALSDSLIAWNKFVDSLSHSHFWVMSTYMGAQYAITRGLFKPRVNQI